MIFVLVTTKKSVRFPGKNEKFLHFTTDWAAIAAQYCAEPVRFVQVGKEKLKDLPPSWLFVECSSGDHLADIEAAEKILAPAPGDVLVLAQITQPLRSRWLLSKIVEMCRVSGGPVVTAQRMPDWRWRSVTADGKWSRKLESDKFFLNGSLFSWPPGRAREIFESRKKHAVLVEPRRWGLIDIDLGDDVPPALAAIWAETLNDIL